MPKKAKKTSTARAARHFDSIKDKGGKVTTLSLTKDGADALERAMAAMGGKGISWTVEQVLLKHYPERRPSASPTPDWRA